jgi:hypothetical protein
MNRNVCLGWTLAGLLFLDLPAWAEVKPVQPSHLAGHGLLAGPATEVLPRGAIIHAQFYGLLPVVDGLEGILKAAAPFKLLPPDAQGLFESPHPLLMLAGAKWGGGPLDEEAIAERFGLAARETATISFYLGDPRRMFILTLPVARSEALAGLLTGLLQPREVGLADLGPGGATRIVPGKGPLAELYVVCSTDRAYLTGDRALALALHALPPAERMGRDDLLKRALTDPTSPHMTVVCDPRLVKPLVVQLQQLQTLGMVVLREQRQTLLKTLSAPQRQQVEHQLRAQFGVDSLEQMADYLEAAAHVTSRQLLDSVANRMLSFEGLCLSARLDSQFPELSLQIYSHDQQPATSTASIPLGEVVRALERIGSDYPDIVVSGRQQAPAANAGMKKWAGAMREEFAARGLKSTWFDQLVNLLAKSQTVKPMEARAPWTLTVRAPVDTQPSLAEAKTLTAYLQSLSLPLNRAVKVHPAMDTAFFEQSLREETEVLNSNRSAEVEFNRRTTGQEPWVDHVNRIRAPRPDAPVRRLVFESAWLTHRGWFGYDRHELINRRWYYARTVDDYLVYHQGGKGPDWLQDLPARPEAKLTPAVARLLDRLPPDVNHFEIHRTLQQLPPLVAWLGAMEDRIHADLQAYLDRAEEVAASAPSVEDAYLRLARLPMPESLYSLNRRPETGALYATLPGNLLFPRPKVVPLLQQVLADYSQVSHQVGGSLVYTRVTPGVWRVSLVQNTEAFTRLVSTVGNALAEAFLSSPEGHERLRAVLLTGQDARPENFEQIVVANPRWNFIPRPTPKREARPANVIPPRDPDTPAALIDLSAYYNGSLDATWHAGGLTNNTLAELPSGIQEFEGVRFDVRGVVQLQGRAAADQLSVTFPKAVAGIPVHRRAQKVHVLHACGWAAEPGTVIGHYVLHYANGERRERPIVYGQDLRDWWAVAEEGSQARVGWSGPNAANPGGPPKSIYLTSWDNPLPEVEVTHLDYTSTMSASAPFLIAITVED